MALQAGPWSWHVLVVHYNRENVGLYKETTKRLTIGKRLQLSENVVCIKMPQNGKPGGGEHEVTGTAKPQLSQQLSSTGQQ